MDISIIPGFSIKIPELAALVALFSSIVTLFTLFEIKKQRKKMYEPALAFGTDNNSRRANSGIGHLKIEMYNIGFGSAKNIKVEWEYCEKLEGIREIFPDLDEEFIEINNILNGSGTTIRKFNDNMQKINFLLPISVTAESTYVKVPLLATTYVLTKIVTDIRKNGSFLDFITDSYNFPFTITYDDINNSKNVKIFLLKLGISFYNSVLEEVYFTMEVIEI